MIDSNQKVENANIRNNAAGEVNKQGKDAIQAKLLGGMLPEKATYMHNMRTFHIHDLEFYNITYNCIGLSVKDMVKDQVVGIRHMLRQLYRGIVDLTNRQSGGIGFIDFDCDSMDYIGAETDEELKEEFRIWFGYLNEPVRKGCEAPYVTLNIGLGIEEKARRITRAVLEAFYAGDECGKPFVFPNIVFKLKEGINMSLDDPNRDLFELANRVTAKRMIPTYLSMDSSFNRSFDSHKLGIMGCRTRVAANVNGEIGAVNRGNLASLTINLPQIAYLSSKSLEKFYANLDKVLEAAKELLLHRYETICSETDLNWLAERKYYLGYEHYHTDRDNTWMMKNGTLAIGFIGLWDAVGILNDHISSIDDIEAHYAEGIEIVKYLRAYTDRQCEETHMNWSLLATAAEGTTGRFARFDAGNLGKGYVECEKGYYTNSFHVPVELKIPYWKKAEFEGPFHALCNGGSITYMEFEEQPYRNVLAVQMAVENAYKNDCGYIGINFPLDVCTQCGFEGRILDSCPKCGSMMIKRFRRVSGYLAEEKTFADGKKAEMKCRVGHFESMD